MAIIVPLLGSLVLDGQSRNDFNKAELTFQKFFPYVRAIKSIKMKSMRLVPSLKIHSISSLGVEEAMNV